MKGKREAVMGEEVGNRGEVGKVAVIGEEIGNGGRKGGDK